MSKPLEGLWYLLRDHTRFVYHYTKAETLVDHILPSRSLLFSRFEAVNDPRESREWVFDFLDITDPEPDYAALQRRLNLELRHPWRIGCFVCDPPEAEMPTGLSGTETIMRAYERGHSRPRMWAQYAVDATNREPFAGACLVFDRGQLDACVRRAVGDASAAVLAERVQYRNPAVLHKVGDPGARRFSLMEMRRLGVTAAIANHIGRHTEELFFTKATDWEQEREFRWAVRSDTNDDFIVHFGESLVGICLGDRLADSARRRIADFCGEHRHISVAVMDWHNGFPQPKPQFVEWLRNGQ